MSILDDFSDYEQPVKIGNHSQVSYVKGEWVESVPTFEDLNMIVLPTRGADLKFLPEGTELVEFKTFYHKSRVAKANDTIEVKGESYTIVNVKDWDGFELVKHFGVIKKDG